MVKRQRAQTSNECIKTKYLKPKIDVIEIYMLKVGWKDG